MILRVPQALQRTWFDFAQIERDLHSTTGAPSTEWDWLSRSYRERERFFQELSEYPGLRPPLPRKSDLSSGVDLYSDFVVSYAQSSQHATRKILYWRDGTGGWQTLSYAELHRRSQSLGDHWLREKCEPGTVLALVLANGPDLLVALCAGLRLGLQLVIVPPKCARYLERKLTALGDTPIWTLSRYRRLLGEHEARVVPSISESENSNGISDASDSYTYPKNAPVLGLFSPQSASSSKLLTVEAAALYGNALRDALLLGLGQVGARPPLLCIADADPVQHVPALLLSALSSGTGMLLLDPDDNPHRDLTLEEILSVHRSHLVLLGESAAAPLALVCQGLLPPPSRLILCPFVAQALRAQSELWQSTLAQTQYSLLQVDTAAGGSVLFSPCTVGGVIPALRVAPACAHQIESPAAPGQPSHQRTGRLRILSVPEDDDGGLILSRLNLDQEYFLGGTLRPTRHGRRYPAADVAELLHQQPSVEGVSVVEQPIGLRSRFAVLAFTFAAPATKERLRLVIEQQLGRDALPDSLLLVPLFPRRLRGQIDHGFYQSQYNQGTLSRLCQDAALQSLNTLRGLVTRRREEGPR